MSLTEQKISGEELGKLIERALKKTAVRKENDLCRYIPGPKGGYIHHFTLKKLKKTDPEQFFSLIQKFVIEKDAPKKLQPKPRAPRGSRKKRDLLNVTRTDIDRILDLARKMGDKELVARFSPKRPLAAIKRELNRSIRQNIINEELWNAYVEAIKLQSAPSLSEGIMAY